MAKALKCDRCGGFFDLLNKDRKYQISDLSGTYPKCVDLCPDCYLKFINFLNGKWRGIDHQEMVGAGEIEKNCPTCRFWTLDKDRERTLKCLNCTGHNNWEAWSGKEESDGNSDT